MPTLNLMASKPLDSDGMPSAATYRYVFAEKPYVCKWAIKTYNGPLLAAVVEIAFRRATDGKGPSSVPRVWVRNNFPYILTLMVYAEPKLARELVYRFKDEFAQANAVLHERRVQRNLIREVINSEELEHERF